MPLPENIIILFYWTAPFGGFLFERDRNAEVQNVEDWGVPMHHPDKLGFIARRP